MNDPTAAGHRRRWIITGAVVAAIVLVGAIAFAMTPRGGSDGTAQPSPSSSTEPSATPSDTSVPEPDESTAPAPEGDGRQTQAPVPIDTPASPEEGVSIRLANIEAVDGEGAGPGETSGPAIRVSVEITNTGSSDLSLAAAIANAFYAGDIPASQLSRPGGVPFPATVAPGATGTGVFVFVVPRDQRADVAITVDLAVRAPIVVFQGPVP